MSKNEKTTKTLEGSIKGYNLTTLALEDVKFKTEFEPAKTSEEAYSRLGNDESVILALLNGALESKALEDEKSKAFGDNYVAKASVLKHVNVHRNSPNYKGLVTVERGKDGWKEQYAKQTEKILSDVKDVPFIMNAIRAEKITEEETE